MCFYFFGLGPVVKGRIGGLAFNNIIDASSDHLSGFIPWRFLSSMGIF